MGCEVRCEVWGVGCAEWGSVIDVGFDVWCSAASVQCSVFDVRCSMFGDRCSAFGARWEMGDGEWARRIWFRMCQRVGSEVETLVVRKVRMNLGGRKREVGRFHASDFRIQERIHI